MRLFMIMFVVFFCALFLTACGGASKQAVNLEPAVDISEPAVAEPAAGSVAEAITDAEPEEEVAEESGEVMAEAGMLQSNFNVVDAQGRVAGTLTLTPFGGAELRDLDGNLIGVLTKPEPAPAGTVENEPGQGDEVESVVYQVDLDEEDDEDDEQDNNDADDNIDGAEEADDNDLDDEKNDD